jgi:hypothetical protein
MLLESQVHGSLCGLISALEARLALSWFTAATPALT